MIVGVLLYVPKPPTVASGTWLFGTMFPFAEIPGQRIAGYDVPRPQKPAGRCWRIFTMFSKVCSFHRIRERGSVEMTIARHRLRADGAITARDAQSERTDSADERPHC